MGQNEVQTYCQWNKNIRNLTKKIMKKTFLLMLALFATITASAQQFVTGNLQVSSKKADFVGVKFPGNSEYTRLDASQDVISLEVMSFGDKGQTFYLDVNVPSGESHMNISWSGSRYRIMKASQNGTDAYVMVDGRTNKQLFIYSIVSSNGKLVAMLDLKSNDGMISDIAKGMTVAEVKSKFTSLGIANADFKESHKAGNLTVYVCRIANLRDNWNGTASVTKKDYGHFYFDAQGKLVKWIIYNN